MSLANSGDRITMDSQGYGSFGRRFLEIWQVVQGENSIFFRWQVMRKLLDVFASRLLLFGFTNEQSAHVMCNPLVLGNDHAQPCVVTELMWKMPGRLIQQCCFDLGSPDHVVLLHNLHTCLPLTITASKQMFSPCTTHGCSQPFVLAACARTKAR